MVTIIDRPIGHKLNTEIASAIIIDYAGDALVYVAGGHSLSDNDVIYIESDFDSYNGFKYVDAVAYDQFKIKNSQYGDYVPYIQDAKINLSVSLLDHGYQSVHLPIVYQLQSNLWPENVFEEGYIPNVVESAQEFNGYTQLNLDRSLNDPKALEYIKLISSDDTDELQGPYQIIQVLHDWSIVINLPWDDDFDFSTFNVIKYYNNYFVTIYVYGGLNSEHPWETMKPYRVLSSIKLQPDSNNKIKFSISDILKGLITTRNNLTLDTLPCNIDFFTQFFIGFTESYDVSDGERISTFESIDTIDAFEGMAINSKMPFKSINHGHMSDYLNEQNIESRWLTLQDRPIAFVDRFFDLSMINQYENHNVIVDIEKSIKGMVVDSEVLTFHNPGKGVLRIPITPESGFDQYCVQASFEPLPGHEAVESEIIIFDLTQFNAQFGSGSSWLFGSNPNALTSTSFLTKNLYSTIFPIIPGATYRVTTTIQAFHNAGTRSQDIVVGFLTAALAEDVTQTQTNGNTGIFSITNTVKASAASKYLFIRIKDNSHASISYWLRAMEILLSVPVPPGTTEKICIDVVDDCNTFINDNLRLLEAGPFRELE